MRSCRRSRGERSHEAASGESPKGIRSGARAIRRDSRNEAVHPRHGRDRAGHRGHGPTGTAVRRVASEAGIAGGLAVRVKQRAGRRGLEQIAMGEQARARRGAAEHEASAAPRHRRRRLRADEHAELHAIEFAEIDAAIRDGSQLHDAVERQRVRPGDVRPEIPEKIRGRRKACDRRREMISGASIGRHGDAERRVHR